MWTPPLACVTGHLVCQCEVSPARTEETDRLNKQKKHERDQCFRVWSTGGMCAGNRNTIRRGMVSSLVLRWMFIFPLPLPVLVFVPVVVTQNSRSVPRARTEDGTLACETRGVGPSALASVSLSPYQSHGRQTIRQEHDLSKPRHTPKQQVINP